MIDIFWGHAITFFEKQINIYIIIPLTLYKVHLLALVDYTGYEATLKNTSNAFMNLG